MSEDFNIIQFEIQTIWTTENNFHIVLKVLEGGHHFYANI